MCGSVTILLALVTRVYAKQVVVRSSSAQDSTDSSVNEVIDDLLDRAVKAWPLRHTDLARTTLGKSIGHSRLPGETWQAAPARILQEVEMARPQGNPLARLFSWTASSQPEPVAKSVDTGEKVAIKCQRVKPYKRVRPQIDKDKKVLATLKEKGVFRSQTLKDGIALAKGVLDVDASPKVVWRQLFDFPSYPGKCPVACAAVVYTPSPSSKSSPGRFPSFSLPQLPVSLPQLPLPQMKFPQLPFLGDHDQQDSGLSFHSKGRRRDLEKVFVKFQSAVLPGIKLTAHCEIAYESKKNSCTWQLDKDRFSHFDEVQGHWHVIHHPDGPSRSRVFYEMGLTVPRWLPQPVVNQLAKFVVKDATQWVKKESEKEAAEKLAKSKKA
eukprot:gnl/MRDRNA2_/MRDRNA2_133243_c0_seq1.p1 gnl/MRDRNA2_/MRDRNA2_133243_c0~~gnl/MRDRNA2_/MRDRNA2_133243_c0_seq1.p1  ORF type:complete len:381 (+),score=57.68 gnl/MRDRNA2_/MRDRNA2_133243_c0_seq1:73-1215(+)